ncbi:MAG: hypothetical protein O7D34_11155 [Ignavibacteria bacterium]|nr:hypothetical protein [Ignavibacteria bacterium]
MRVKEEQILYDARGRKTHVVLPVKKYEELLERLEDLNDLWAMRQVEAEKSITWQNAKKKLRKIGLSTVGAD